MGDRLAKAPHLRLGVNIDHVATVRNARGSAWPDDTVRPLTPDGAARFRKEVAGLADERALVHGMAGPPGVAVQEDVAGARGLVVQPRLVQVHVVAQQLPADTLAEQGVRGLPPVGAVVTFIDGQPSKDLYRRFHIKDLAAITGKVRAGEGSLGALIAAPLGQAISRLASAIGSVKVTPVIPAPNLPGLIPSTSVRWMLSAKYLSRNRRTWPRTRASVYGFITITPRGARGASSKSP